MQLSTSPDPIRAGEPATLKIALTDQDREGTYQFQVFHEEDPAPEAVFDGQTSITFAMAKNEDYEPAVFFERAGQKTLRASIPGSEPAVIIDLAFTVAPGTGAQVPQLNVALIPEGPPQSADEVLWSFIEQITNKIRFDEFQEFYEKDLCSRVGAHYGASAYEQLETAAHAYVRMAADPTNSTDPGRVPTLHPELGSRAVRDGITRSYVSGERADLAKPFLTQTCDPLPNVPFVELIWNYWIEEGMLVQTLNRIVARFQNRHPASGPDKLARFAVNPLLPAREYLWGLAEAEQRRLSVRRRAAEYEYEYGICLLGRAVPASSTMVERRSQFLEAFHTLLNACAAYYKELADKTLEADPFPLLSSLRELHLVLARGAHNQFADLPMIARAEMLTIQWLLALPEMREFLGGPTMVPYEEPWMDRVDAMKSIQGWSDVSITHFNELAVHGEQIVLSVRHGRWNDSRRKREDAANWAYKWRNAIQRYIHAYRTVTGVDLTEKVLGEVDVTMPSVLLAKRLEHQHRL